MTDSPQPAFLRPGKILWLLLAGLLVYLFTLIILLPAGWLWHWASPQLNLPEQVQIHQVSGRLWQGAAGLSVNSRPLRFSWRLGAPSISELGLPLNFSLESAHSQLKGRLDLSWPAEAQLAADGVINIREFEDLIRRSGGAMLEGEVAVEQLTLAWNDGEFGNGHGLARWPGGEVTWPMGGGLQSAEFPPMEASLNAQSGRASLSVSQQGQSEPAADADLFQDGMLEIRVYKRMIDLAGQSWSGAASPGDVVFRVRQPLLPGRGR